MTASLTLWINPETNTLMSDWNSTTQLPTPTVKQGDTIRVELHLIKMIASAGSVMQEIEWSPASSLTLAIGMVQASPTFGTFTLTFGANETVRIPFDADATIVEDAINDMASIIAVGGVSVSLQGTAFRVIFDNAGVLPFALNYNENDLFPSSSIGVAVARAGTASVRAIYQVQIKQSPVAYIDTFGNATLSVATVTVMKEATYAGDTKSWRMQFDPPPKEGSFTLSFLDSGVLKTTAPMHPYSTEGDVEAYLNEINDTTLLVRDFVVKKSASYSWDISTTKTTITALNVDTSGFKDYSGKQCLLSLNNVEVENLLGGAVSATATLEIELDTNGIRHTLIQTPITIVNDLIDEADYTVVSRTEVMPVESVVRYDTSQSLTSEQKLQARTNIGAASITVDVDALVTTVGNIDTRLSTVEGQALTSDQKGAIESASLPTALNPFVTGSVLTASLSGYTASGHTHTVAQVTGLQLILDAKAGLVHTHDTAAISGLDDALLAINNSLSFKSNVSHTHTISSIDGLTLALQSYATLTQLQPLLNAKANIFHTQDISTISGLSFVLSNLGQDTTAVNNRVTTVAVDVGDLDSRVDILEQFPSTFTDDINAINLTLTSIQVSVIGVNTRIDDYFLSTINTQTAYTGGTNFTTIYPKELYIQIEGVGYLMPARLA